MDEPGRRAGWRVLVTCEHASPSVPADIDLGLPPALLHTHIAYDRGAKEIARALAAELDAPLHLGAHNRLVVDLNRREDNPAVILAETYGVEVPGNVGLDDAAREARLARYHRPYREAARADAHALAEHGGCFHLSIHSFDPTLDPAARAFDAGVLFDPSREPERTLAEALAAELGRSETVAESDRAPQSSWVRPQGGPTRRAIARRGGTPERGRPSGADAVRGAGRIRGGRRARPGRAQSTPRTGSDRPRGDGRFSDSLPVDTRLNAPYLGTPEGLTSWLRGQLPASRYVGIELEACQRWMDHERALPRFAERLADAVRRVLPAAPLG